MIGKFVKLALGRWQLSLGILAAVVLALSLSYCKGRADGRALEQAEQARAAAQAVADARKADAAGMETARAGKAASGAEIERGRGAAAKATDDPWGKAVEAMRPQ